MTKNIVDYGLKFEIKELEKMQLQAKAIDKYFNSIANSTKFKSLSDAIGKMNTLFKNQEAILGMVNNKRDLEIKKQKELINLQQQRKKLEQEIINIAGRTSKNGNANPRSSAGRTNIGGNDGGKFDMFAPAKVGKRVAGYIGLSTAIYGTLAALRSGRDAIIDYDQALHNTYMAIGNVTEAEKTMIKSITTNIEFTAKYGKSFVELAKSMEVLTKAGFKVNEATILLEPSLRLAAAGDMELDEAARALSQSLRNVGKPMAYASEMADALASGAAASAVDVKDLITSFEGVGAVGTNFGMQTKEIVAWLGALGNVGLKGRESANAISRLWLRLTKPQKEVMDILKGKGIELFEGNGTEKRIRKFEDIIKDLSNASLSLQEKQKLLGIHAGKTAEQIFSAIPSYRALAIEMESISNSAEAMSKAKMEGLQSKIDTMKSAWQDIFISQNGISNAMGASIDKLKSLFILLAENPQLTRLLAIGASAGAASLATGAITKNPYAIGAAAIGAAGVSTYLLKDMQASNYNSTESIAERKKQEELAKKRMEAESDYVNKIANVKLYSLKKLKEEQSLLNKELQKYVNIEDEINKKLNTAKGQIKQGIISPTDFYSRTSQFQSQKKMNTEDMIASMESFKLRSIQQEITKRQTPINLDTTGTGGKTEKELKDRYKSPILQFRKLEQETAMQTLPKYLADIAKMELDAFEKKEKEKQDLMETYDTFTQLMKLSQQEQELLSLADSEEAKYNIRVEYAEKTGELLSAQYEKEHQITSAFWQSVQAGQQSFTNSLIDMDMTGKERREAIWTSFRDFFLKAIIDMAMKYIAFVAITNLLPGGFSGGFGGMLGKIFGVGAGSFGVGTKLNDAVVADGKVYPYRKDDLVMIGTNLDNRSGATLPTQSMVSGGGSKNDNSAVISELRSLRLAVARSDANNIKAIAENTPIIQGTMMDDIKVYKSSKIGERKSNFVVQPK